MDGNSGGDGSDTFVEAVYSDGNVREIMRCKGGRGGSISDDIPIRVEASMLASSAELSNGLFFVLGAGWKHFIVPSLPAQISFCALGALATDTTASQLVEIRMELLNHKDDVVLSGALQTAFEDGHCKFVFNIVAVVEEIGEWKIILTHKEQFLCQIPFEIRLMQ